MLNLSRNLSQQLNETFILKEVKNKVKKQKDMNNVQFENPRFQDEGSLSTIKNKSICEATEVTAA